MTDHGQTQPIKILLAEDHVDTAKVMRILLERHGFFVRAATTVADALGAAREEHFDLSICDMRLPDGDGRLLARKLLELHNIKSICLSGDDAALHDLGNDPNSGFAECLTKPIDLAKVLAAIQRIMA